MARSKKPAVGKAAAQTSLFDLANQKVIEAIREPPDSVSAEEAKESLLNIKKPASIDTH